MKPKIFTVILVSLSTALSVVLGEAVLRSAGHRPWTYAVKNPDEPIVHEPDPDLGWRNKEGDYMFPAYDSSGRSLHMTFTGRGQRLSRAGDAAPDRDLVIVGGSYAQGWAISDNETFAWKLQEKYPSLNVLNYGTAGYGSYQSLLTLERELPRLSPAIVLYGFVQHHEVRNVASYKWVKSLSKFSRRGHVDLPYVTLDEEGALARHAPRRYLTLPLRESLATVALIESAYMKLRAKSRIHRKRPATERVLLEMARLVERHGAQFVLAILSADPETKSHYVSFFQEKNIRHVDCAYPMTPDMIVVGEGHPNGRMNARWAECIAKKLGAGV